MTKLSAQLKYFIVKKITEDSEWQQVKVIFSGHDVPGEGEHKIMEYIRTARSQQGHNPNLRHCLYGLDADLIMLGLLSHEPHFALLREEVKFGRQNKQNWYAKFWLIFSTPEQQTFYLLHLSLLREYIEIEFQPLKNALSFEFDLEKIIDDFIALIMLIGNDFIPHLPDLHINTGALGLMFETYKRLLPELGLL